MKTLLLMALLMSAYSVQVQAQDDSDSITIDDSAVPAETMETPTTYEEGGMDSMPSEDSSEDSGDYEVVE